MDQFAATPNKLRYFAATPLILTAKVFARLSRIVSGHPVEVLDFATLKVMEIDFDETDEDIM